MHFGLKVVYGAMAFGFLSLLIGQASRVITDRQRKSAQSKASLATSDTQPCPYALLQAEFEEQKKEYENTSEESEVEEKFAEAAKARDRLAAAYGEIYKPNVSTPLGCECEGACTTSFAMHCWVQPFCIVKNKKCAHGTAHKSMGLGLTSTHFDYCNYDPFEDYESKSASEKHKILLNKILENTAHSSYPGTATLAKKLLTESVKVSFEAQSDVFPEPRVKIIHSVGVVAPIAFKAKNGTKYDGLFKGAPYGFIRLSSAKQPDVAVGYNPGLGLKLLQDGKPSINLLAMPTLDPQKCGSNFFAAPFTTHIGTRGPDFSLKLLTHKFWQASHCPLMVGLKDFAGTEEGAKFPFEISMSTPYQGTMDASQDFNWPCANLTEALNMFKKLPKDEVLFKVSAKENPESNFEHIGDVVMTGKFTTSKFGDESLFFKHQYMEDDFKVKKTWLQSKHVTNQTCGMNNFDKRPTVENGCTSEIHGGVSGALGDTSTHGHYLPGRYFHDPNIFRWIGNLPGFLWGKDHLWN